MSVFKAFGKIHAFLAPGTKDMGGTGRRKGLEWTGSLAQVGEGLDRLIAESEEGFLSIGEKLQEYYSRAQEMCGKSGEVVEIMTGDGLSQATVGLTTILDELESHLKDTASHFERISDVFRQHMEALEKVSSYIEDFRMLMLNMSMLGFLTRVESAYLSGGSSGFASLTADVRKLSDLIKEKSLQISDASKNVQTFVSLALTEIADFEETQSESARTTHQQAVANHRSLSRKYESASESARLIEQRTKEIASSIGNIVMSMQFHDITRQQIAHVKEVLEHLCARIRENDPEGIQQAAMVRDILKLQRAQLRQAQDDLVGAVLKIIENLHAISTSVGEILHETQEVAWASETQGLSFMDDIDRGITEVIACIKLTADEEAELTETVSQASSMVSEMSVFVRDIETLGLTLQLIALNARIKAAHLGTEGAALDTISGSIYELSRHAREDTNSLTGVLASLVDLSGSFKEDLKAMREKQTRTVELMVDKLKGLIASLHGINRTVLSMLSGITSLGESLLKDIEATACGVTVHTEVENRLSEVTGIIEETREGARLICPYGEDMAALAFLEDIDKLYTMKSERLIHEQQFDSSQTDDGRHGTPNARDDLGDNVELF